MMPAQMFSVLSIVLVLLIVLLLGLAFIGWVVRALASIEDQPSRFERPARPRLNRARLVRRTRTSPRSSSGNNRLVVKADRRELWRIRGWRVAGRKLIGAFRTPSGSCAGEIELDRAGRAKNFFIVNPALGLLQGSHGACFRSRGGGRFWVHFSRPNTDPDSGIVAVESLLREALS